MEFCYEEDLDWFVLVPLYWLEINCVNIICVPGRNPGLEEIVLLLKHQISERLFLLVYLKEMMKANNNNWKLIQSILKKYTGFHVIMHPVSEIKVHCDILLLTWYDHFHWRNSFCWNSFCLTDKRLSRHSYFWYKV